MSSSDDDGGQGGNREPERRQCDDKRGRFNSDLARYGPAGGRYVVRLNHGRTADRAGVPRPAAEPLSYAGQEYGMEGHGYGVSGGGGLESQNAPAAASPAAPDDDLEPDYLRWRDEQLSRHDRDYQEWRTYQQSMYDEDYRRFRREAAGRTFDDWRTAGRPPDATGAPTPRR